MALKVTDFLDNQSYTALQTRRWMSALPFQPGVIATMEYPDPLLPLSTNQEMVPTGFTIMPGSAWVPSTVNNGWYHVVNDGQVEFVVSIDHLTGTQESFDRIVIEVEDTTDLGSLNDRAYFRQVTGTPQGSANWNNPVETQGVPTLADNQVNIAVIQNKGPSPSGNPVVAASNIRDVRQYARGARWMVDWTEGDETTSSTSYVNPDAGLGTRINTHSGLIRCRLNGSMTMGASIYTAIFAIQNGVSFSVLNYSREFSISNDIAAVRDHLVDLEWVIPVTPGVSTFFQPSWKLNSAVSTTLRASTAYPLLFEIEEIWQPDRSNG